MHSIKHIRALNALIFLLYQKYISITDESSKGMISSLFVLLLLIGFSGMLLSREYYARFVSLLVMLTGLAMLMNMGYHMQIGTTQQVVWNLLNYDHLRVDLDLSTTANHYALIMPFFLMMFFSLLHTYYTPLEERRGRLSSLMLVVMAFLMLLICADNFLILIVSASLCGIGGIYIVNDFAGKKTYVFYTLVADMSLFAAMSIIYSATSNVDLSAIISFSEYHKYRDLAALLMLLGISIKSGLFLFHKQIFSYAALSFNRLIFLSYCASPACGLILFYKMSSLFYASDMCQTILLTLSILSVAYGLGGALIYDSLKEKALSINMLLWGSLFIQALVYHNNIFPFSGLLIVLFYLLNFLLAEIYISGSEEVYISRLGGTWKKLPMLLLAFFALSLAILHVLITNAYAGFSIWWIEIAIVMILCSYLIHQIFFGANACDEKVWAFMKHPPFLLQIPVFVGVAYAFYYNTEYSWLLLCGFGLLILLVIIHPLRKLAYWYERDELQLSEFFERFYEVVLLAPLSIMGRVLWLTVDFLLIERTILSSLAHTRNALINLSSHMHSCRLVGYILTTLLGIILMFILGNVLL